MYSDPLITYNALKWMISAGEPVNFDQEISNLKTMFQKLNISLRIRIKISTFENL